MYHTCFIDDTLCPDCQPMNSRGVFVTKFRTENGRYSREHDTMAGAWHYVQGFMAVNNRASWEITRED